MPHTIKYQIYMQRAKREYIEACKAERDKTDHFRGSGFDAEYLFIAAIVSEFGGTV